MNNLIFIQNFEQFINGGFLSVIKICIIFAFALYAAFSFVVLTQIRRMFQVLSTGAKAHIYSISGAHVILSLVALLWAIMVL